VLGYTARGEVIEKIAAHREMQMQWKERIAAAELEEIRQDPDLFQFALASGRANFAVNCSQCHGSGAAGNPGGYPNLNDDAWIWGGDLENIYLTIKHGVRNEDDPDARYAEMPRYGVDELLSEEEIDAAVAACAELHRPGDQARAAGAWRGDLGIQLRRLPWRGRARATIYAGAPNLTDNIWLYGGEPQDIRAQIWRPQQGVMPAWGLKLDDTTVKELAVYVHSLGGGETAVE
jgi:cytochrome c oxidase cbb3-type subunit 3